MGGLERVVSLAGRRLAERRSLSTPPRRAAPAGRRREFDCPAGSASPNRPGDMVGSPKACARKLAAPGFGDAAPSKNWLLLLRFAENARSDRRETLSTPTIRAMPCHCFHMGSRMSPPNLNDAKLVLFRDRQMAPVSRKYDSAYLRL